LGPSAQASRGQLYLPDRSHGQFRINPDYS
jgi:hypothetical protein